MKKYVWLHSAAELRAAMAADRTMALLLAMTATAFITLVIWENIFPDRRDSRTLGVLPIRNRSFVVARLTAIVGLFSLLFLLTTALSSIAFGVLGAMTQLPEGFARVTIAHFLAVSAAEGCIFFGMLAAQCFLMIAFGPSAAHRLAVVLQIALIVTVLQMPMVLPPGQSFALTGGMPGWAATPSAALLPPLWFLSLYQSCVGAGYEGAGHLSRAAALLGILTPIAALTFYGASYARLTRLAVEGRPVPRRSVRQAGSGLVDRASRLLTSTPAGAAVCAFTLRTAVRSRQHRMLLAVWIGVALALTISAAVPVVVRLGWKAFEVPRGALLVGPLIFSVLVQTGLRSLFAIPVEVKANWAFRMAEPVRLSEALAGGAAALTVAGVLPSMLLAFASAAWLWGPAAGVKHAIFCGAVGIVLVQVLMRARRQGAVHLHLLSRRGPDRQVLAVLSHGLLADHLRHGRSRSPSAAEPAGLRHRRRPARPHRGSSLVAAPARGAAAREPAVRRGIGRRIDNSIILTLWSASWRSDPPPSTTLARTPTSHSSRSSSRSCSR